MVDDEALVARMRRRHRLNVQSIVLLPLRQLLLLGCADGHIRIAV